MKLDASPSAVSLQESCLCIQKQTSTLHGSFSRVSPVDFVLSGTEYLICRGNKAGWGHKSQAKPQTAAQGMGLQVTIFLPFKKWSNPEYKTANVFQTS